MNQPTFTVSRFENRNGSISWRVDGSLHGVRIRRNFKTREEAAVEKAVPRKICKASGQPIRLIRAKSLLQPIVLILGTAHSSDSVIWNRMAIGVRC